MRLFLIRHPRPAVADGICYGRSDLPLAEDAAACAARLRPLLPAAPLYSSPLQRCRLLAQALHAAPAYDERLREADFGAWEMRPWRDIGRAAIDAWAADPLHFAAHGGESVAQLQSRVLACVADIAARHDAAVLVVHAGVMKVLAAALTGMAEAEWFRLGFDYGTASLIEDGRLVWHNASTTADNAVGARVAQ
ncbi:MAG: alpha-ribazole phosphatase family protein [Rhodocyclales bacterium]|nr:alpha-ribazole phosphatase family protein [Rhodocyclales bacterium]